MSSKSAPSNSRAPFLSSGAMRWGWLSLFLVVLLEVYLWTKGGDQSFVKAFQFHVYAFSVIGLYFASRYIIWKRMNHLIKPLSSSLKYCIQLILIATLSLGIVTLPLGQVFVLSEPPLVLLMGSYIIGVILFMSGAMLTLSVSTYIMRMLIWRRVNKESKDAILRLQSIISLFLTLMLCSIGIYHSRNIQIKYVAIPISGLDHSLNGTTIVQLSDIHMGPFIGHSHVEAVVKRANKLNGDIVTITGDLIDSSVSNLWDAAKPLQHLNAKYGVYYTTGNHEYYSGDVDRWIEKLPELHVKPLINDRTCISSIKDSRSSNRNNFSCYNGFYLAGLEDIETRRLRYGHHSMDIHKALSGRTEKIPTIVLAHQPCAAAEAIHWNDVKLVLSGHTHAGETLLLMLPIYIFNPFFAGLYEPLPGIYVYVNAGTHYMLPYRHCRPEITHLTLISM